MDVLPGSNAPLSDPGTLVWQVFTTANGKLNSLGNLLLRVRAGHLLLPHAWFLLLIADSEPEPWRVPPSEQNARLWMVEQQ